MTSVRYLMSLTYLMTALGLIPIANAQGSLKLPKIDRDAIGLPASTSANMPNFEVPAKERPKDALSLTPAEAERLAKELENKKQPTYHAPVVESTRVNPRLDGDKATAKSILDELAKGGSKPSFEVKNTDPADRSVEGVSAEEKEVHESILKEHFGSYLTIWTRVANDVFQGEAPNVRESNRLKRLLFADYLDYLNAVGLELASYEITLKAAKEKAKGGKCSEATADEYEQNLIDSVQSDPATFATAYCNNVCKDQSYFLERAKFAAPDGALETCAEKARRIYDQFNCNEFGQHPRESNETYFATAESATVSESLKTGRADTALKSGGSKPSLPNVTDLNSSVSNEPDRGPILNVDTDLFKYRVDFESSLQKQTNNCKRLRYIQTRTIWTAPDGQDRTAF